MWPDNSLQSRLKIFELYPDIDCVTSLYLYWYKSNFKPGETHKLNTLNDSITSKSHQLIQGCDKQFYELTPFQLGTAIFMREKFLSAGGLNESLYIGEDWLFWLMFSESKKILFSPVVTLHLRRQHASLMNGEKMTSFSAVKADFYAIFLIKGITNKKRVWWRLLSNLNSLIDNCIKKNQYSKAMYFCMIYTFTSLFSVSSIHKSFSVAKDLILTKNFLKK
mgnify:CR=1 FL=1